MKKPSRIILFLLIGLTVAISATSFIAALSWLNKPFPGFMVYAFPYVGSYSLKEWSGRQAGIKFMDRIVAVDGRPVFSGKDIYRHLEGRQPGDSVRYKVESKGKSRDVEIPITLFSLKDLLLTFGTIFPCGLALFIISFTVLVLKPNMASSWVFSALGLSMAGYLVSGLDSMTSHLLVPLHFLLGSIYPFANFHLALVFPNRKPVLARFPRLEYLIYVPSFFLAVAWLLYIHTYSQLLQEQGLLSSLLTYPVLGSITRIFLFVSVLGSVTLILRSYFKAATVEARQRAKIILLGMLVGFLPPVIVMLGSHLLKMDPAWNFLPFLVIFFPASIAYAIIRHNLFDADVIIRRTVGYFGVTVVIVGVYVLVSLGLNLFLGAHGLTQSQAFPILFTLGVILIFNPVRNRFQNIVDRLFFRKEYDYGAIVDKAGRAISSLLDLNEILKGLTRIFVEDLFVSTSSIMLLNKLKTEYTVHSAEGEKQTEVEGKLFLRDGPLITLVEKNKKEITKFDLLEDPKYRGVSETCLLDFATVQASLIVPLVFQDQVIGLMTFGDKKSGKVFSRQDLDLLKALANQGAVAIENALLFQENLEKQRMEEELSIARALQMSMLPTSCPTLEGFQIAALSTPAKEVGGDFFDFFLMDEETVGLIIGDVTGKSVSGALVMSASRSVFRMLSEEHLPVGDIMVRANKRIKKDIKTGMFVALLYALIDSRNNNLHFCSAGQTQPVKYSSIRQEAVLLDTLGDKFPLGILAEADYQETTINLEKGDRVIFYTDGIVEAMNPNKELFGFDRLLDLIKEFGALQAEGLLSKIISQVDAFCAGAPPNDDLTVIVVSC